jgi:hypothetical protein
MEELAALETRLTSRMRRERLYGFAMGAALLLTLASAWPKAGASQERQSGNTYSVDVVNASTAAVPVHNSDNLAHDPFYAAVNPSPFAATTLKVPLHKRLVITSVDCYNYTNTVFAYELIGKTAGQDSDFVLPLPGGAQEYAWQVQAVFDPGTTLYVSADDTNSDDMGGQNVNVHGYYVDEDGYYRNTGY